MKKLLTIVAAIILAVSPACADNYSEQLRKWLVADSVTLNGYKLLLSTIVQTSFTNNAEIPQDEAKVLLESLPKYLESQCAIDIANVFAPHYKNYISEAQLLQLNAIISRPEIRKADIHLGILSVTITSKMQALFADKSALQKSPVFPKCSEAYMQKFDVVWSNVFKKTITSAMKAGVKNGIPEAEVEKQIQGLLVRVKALILTEFVREVPETELGAMAELTQTEAYSAYVDAQSTSIPQLTNMLLATVKFDVSRPAKPP